MEAIFKKMLFMFKSLHLDVNIYLQIFTTQKYLPYRNAQQVLYQINMENDGKACKNLLLNNSKDAALSSNDTLIAAAIFDA